MANPPKADQCSGETIDGRFRLTDCVGGPREYLFHAQPVEVEARPQGNLFLSSRAVGNHSDRLLIELAWPTSVTRRSKLVSAARRRAGVSNSYLANYCDVGTIDHGKLSGCVFLVTEGVGNSLAEILGCHKPLEPTQLISLVRSIGEALVRLHSRGDLLGPITSSDLFRDQTGWKLRPSLDGLCKGLSSAEANWQATDDIRAIGLLLQQFAKGSEKLRVLIDRCVAKRAQDRPSATEIALACTEVPPVTDAILSRNDNGFELHWEAPERGQVRVLRPSNDRTFRVGEVLLTSQLSKFGELLSPNGEQSFQFGGVVREEQVVIVTIDGLATTVGGVIRLSGLPDVSGLSANYGAGKLSLTWNWPMGIDKAVVSSRNDRFPAHPYEEDALRHPVSRARYAAEGVRLSVPASGDQLYVAVFSMKTASQGTSFSSAATTGARISVPLGICRKLRYEIVRKTESASDDGHGFQLHLLADQPTELPGLLLMAKPTGFPTSPDDGTCVLRVPAGTYCLDNVPTAVAFSVPESYRDVAWQARLFPADTELGRWLTFVPKRHHKSGWICRKLSGAEWLLVFSILATLIGILCLMRSSLSGAELEVSSGWESSGAQSRGCRGSATGEIRCNDAKPNDIGMTATSPRALRNIG